MDNLEEKELLNSIIKEKYLDYYSLSTKYFKLERMKNNILSKLDIAKKLHLNIDSLKFKLDRHIPLL